MKTNSQTFRKDITKAPATSRSRVSNGTALLLEVDGRSALSRRYRDITAALVSDAGGFDHMSEARKVLCRTFASTAVMLERLDAQLVNGGAVDVNQYAQLASTLVRIANKIGLNRSARNITPTLAEYLDAKANEPEAAT